MYRSPHKYVSIPSEAEQRAILSRVRDMFYHGYDSYMQHAFPEAELRPLSCSGGQFELVKIPLVTLIDTLDTLVILGNYTEVRGGGFDTLVILGNYTEVRGSGLDTLVILGNYTEVRGGFDTLVILGNYTEVRGWV